VLVDIYGPPINESAGLYTVMLNSIVIISCHGGCALYDQLIAQGRQSLRATLKVGAAIEEIDIRDLLACSRCNGARAASNALMAKKGAYHLTVYAQQIAFGNVEDYDRAVAEIGELIG
jgi:hypothetical protein